MGAVRSQSSHRTSAPDDGGNPRIWYKPQMHLDAAHPLLPIVTLAAGVFLIIAPRIVSLGVTFRTEWDLLHLQIVPGDNRCSLCPST